MELKSSKTLTELFAERADLELKKHRCKLIKNKLGESQFKRQIAIINAQIRKIKQP